MYINQLPLNEQKAIQAKLKAAGLDSEQIQDAMDSKLEDIKDLFNATFDDGFKNEEGETVLYVCPTCADHLNLYMDNPTAIGTCFVYGCESDAEFEIK